MQSVTVLTPHGHRHVVKVEPNKTVLWILEQVCVKFPKFSADDFGFKHHNKLLDLSQMYRFAGLPNNSTLEMVEVDKKRVEQDLVICLQLEDGTRLNGDFPSSSTLREVISKLSPEKSSPDQKPVVIYMRSELHSEALDTTTLRSLGLSSGGRALLRLINADPETLKVQANVSAPLPQKPREKSPERPRQRSNVEQQPGPSSSAVQFEAIKRAKQEAKEPESFVEAMEVEEGKVEVEEEKVEVAIKEVAQPQSPPEPEPVINILDSRGTIIFTLDSMQTSTVDLPDSFFDLTESEVRKLYRELKIHVDEVENRPLLTTEFRKLEENKKILNQLSIYKSCAIRIQMPNRYVIQSKFSTVETVGAVMDLVREFLIDPAMEFHLFVTPPKSILDKTATLIESHCVPSALLHFGCDVVGEYLNPEVLEKLSSGSGASRILAKVTGDEMAVDDGASGSVTKKPIIPQNFLPSKVGGGTSKSTGAVPKWFKPGK